jgi:Fur family peroxide stress response transcriptional regulator
MNERQKQVRLARFEELCRARGLSVTVQRRVIFEALLGRSDHPTPDGVYERVKGRLPGLSRTTVYRVLETLVDIGVATKACAPGAAIRFDPLTHRHHHLICMRCEKLTDLEDDEVVSRVEWPDVRARAFQIHNYSIHFHGLCAACRRKAEPGKSISSAARGGAKKEKCTHRREKSHGAKRGKKQ